MAAHLPGRGGQLTPPPWWAWFAAAVVLGKVTVAVLVAKSRPAPGSVSVSLPAGPAYRLSQQVTSGYLRASVPQSPGASRTISAQITSGELALVTR